MPYFSPYLQVPKCRQHLTTKKGGFILEWDENNVNLIYGNIALFPKRAILCVGMLLRDSEIEGKAPFTKRSSYAIVKYLKRYTGKYYIIYL